MKIQLRPAAKAAGSKSPTTASRKALQAQGQAMPGGRYPIPNVDFLQRAIKSIGRTPPGKRAAVVAWIKKRAAALGRTDLVQNLSNELKALEMAGALANVGGFIPGKTQAAPKGKMPAVPDSGSGASKKPPKSKVSGGGLKTAKGKAIYAKLCAKGFPPALSMKAAKKAEQGLNVDEMSNPFKAPKGDTPGKTDADGDDDGDTKATVAAKNKLGFKNHQALQAYRKAKKKGLPHALALKAAKLTDRKLGDPKARAAKENANSPKA